METQSETKLGIELIHPGVYIKEYYLDELGITPYKMAKDIKVSQTLIGNIIKGKSGVTAEMALRLSKYFGTTPQLWLNLQKGYDLERVKQNMVKEIEGIEPLIIA